MAQSYESTAQDIMDTLNGSDLSQTSKDAIAGLLAALGGSAVAVAAVENNLSQNDLGNLGDSALIMQSGDTSANVAFAANSPVKGIIVGSGGNSNVQFATSDDVTVVLQGGMNDSVSTAAGNDTIALQGGSATVNTGDGNDMITVDMGPNSTGYADLDGGTGFDVLRAITSVAEHTFQFVRGKFHMNSDYELDMSNINIIGFSENAATGADDVYDTATVLATTASQSLTAKLYQVALDRDNGGLDNVAQGATSQLQGLEFWNTYQEDTNDTLEHTVYSFLNCEEFHNRYDALTDEQYVQALFENLGVSTSSTIGGKSVADYVATIAGNMDAMVGRYNVAWAIAASNETVQLYGIDATDPAHQYVIDASGMNFDNPLG